MVFNTGRGPTTERDPSSLYYLCRRRDGTELPPPRGMVQSVNLHATVGPLIPQVYDENLTEFSSSGVVLCSNTRAALL